MVCGAVYLCVYIVGVYTHSQIPAILSFSLFRNIHFKLVGLCEVFFLLFIKKKKKTLADFKHLFLYSSVNSKILNSKF